MNASSLGAHCWMRHGNSSITSGMGISVAAVVNSTGQCTYYHWGELRYLLRRLNQQVVIRKVWGSKSLLLQNPAVLDFGYWLTQITVPLSGTTRVNQYQEGKSNLDFTEARDSEWQWHQLGHMQVCTSIQTDNHASSHHSVFYRPDALPVAQPTASKH